MNWIESISPISFPGGARILRLASWQASTDAKEISLDGIRPPRIRNTDAF